MSKNGYYNPSLRSQSRLAYHRFRVLWKHSAVLLARLWLWGRVRILFIFGVKCLETFLNAKKYIVQLPYSAVSANTQNKLCNVLKYLPYYVVAMIEISLRVYRVDHNSHHSLQT